MVISHLYKRHEFTVKAYIQHSEEKSLGPGLKVMHVKLHQMIKRPVVFLKDGQLVHYLPATCHKIKSNKIRPKHLERIYQPRNIQIFHNKKMKRAKKIKTKTKDAERERKGKEITVKKSKQGERRKGRGRGGKIKCSRKWK